MSGLRQTPSGTPFDPLPQFCVFSIGKSETADMFVEGTCFFAPVNVGTKFNQIASRSSDEWSFDRSCDLVVLEIEIFRDVLVDTLDQNFNAKLSLGGSSEQAMRQDDLLLAPSEADFDRWQFDGHLWTYEVS